MKTAGTVKLSGAQLYAMCCTVLLAGEGFARDAENVDRIPNIPGLEELINDLQETLPVPKKHGGAESKWSGPLPKEWHSGLTRSGPKQIHTGDYSRSAALLENVALVFLYPEALYQMQGVEVPCPDCKSSLRVELDGWSKPYRRICGIKCTYVLITLRYCCMGCPLKAKQAAGAWPGIGIFGRVVVTVQSAFLFCHA